jgi:sulfatase maturation enzyme AslB (radical SAM superfamily)
MGDSRRIKSVTLILTSQCNLRCSYCFENDKKSGRMGWETVRQSVDWVLDSERDEIELVFFGGEPLLEFDMMKRAVEYAEENLPPGKSLKYAISTNGLLLDDRTVGFLTDRWFRTQLSFDGVSQAQAYRAKGTFEKLDALLDRLSRDHRTFYRNNLWISLALIPQAIPHFADSIEYFVGKGIQKIEVTPSGTSEPFWNDAMMPELEEQFERIGRVSQLHYAATREIPFHLFSGRPPRGPQRRVDRRMCGVRKGNNPVVDVNAEVHGCATFADSYQAFSSEFLKDRIDSMRLGRVGTADLRRRFEGYAEAVDAAELFGSKSLKYSSYGRCGECEYVGSCSVCPMTIGYTPGNTDPYRVPDFPCAYNLVALRHRDRFWDAMPKRSALPWRDIWHARSS